MARFAGAQGLALVARLRGGTLGLTERESKQSRFLVANTVTTALLGMGYWAVAARTVPIDAVGSCNALIAAIATISAFAQLNLYASMSVLVPRMGKHRARLILRVYLVTSTATVLATSAVLVFFPRLLSIGDSSRTSLLWVVPAAVLWTLFNLQGGALISVRGAHIVFITNFLYSLLKLILLLVLAGHDGAMAIRVSWYGSLLVVVPVANFMLWRQLRRDRGTSHGEAASSPSIGVRGLMRFVAVDVVGFAISELVINAMPVYVAALTGAADAAIYATCAMIFIAVDLVISNVAISMSVSMSIDPARVPRVLLRTGSRLVGLFAAAMLTAAACAPIILAFFGSRYAEFGTGLLRLLLLSCVFRAIVTLCSAAVRSLLRPGRVILIQATNALVVLGVGLPLLSAHGLLALGWTWLAGEFVAAGVSVVAVVLLVRNDRPLWSEPHPSRPGRKPAIGRIGA